MQNIQPILDGYREMALDDAEAVKFYAAQARKDPSLANCRRLKWKMELAAKSMQAYIEKELQRQRLHPDFKPVVPVLGSAS